MNWVTAKAKQPVLRRGTRLPGLSAKDRTAWLLLGIFLNGCGIASGGRDGGRDLGRPSELPRSAIGKLIAKIPEGYYVCSGTLIAEDRVLTAGHCLLNEDGTLRSSEIRFLPALSGELQADTPKAKGVFQWHDSLFGGAGGTDTEVNRLHDWAILQLDAKFPQNGVLEFASEDVHTGDSVEKFGYPQAYQGGWKLSEDRDCKVSTEMADYPFVFWSSCEVSQGDSGGPVLVFDRASESFKIAGINVAEGNKELGSFHLRASYVQRAAAAILR